MQRALLLLCGLCVLLAAEAFSPAALPAGLSLRTTARDSACSLRAAADGISRRSVLTSAAVAAVGLSSPMEALAAKAKAKVVEEKEEEEEEEEEEAAPAPQPKGKAKDGQGVKPTAAPTPKGPRKQFQGTAKGNVESVGPSIVGLAVKAIAGVALVGGGGYAAMAFSKKYGSDKGKALDKENGVPWKNGFTSQAENWNGRAAMLGFAGILVLELLTGQGITTGLGLLGEL